MPLTLNENKAYFDPCFLILAHTLLKKENLLSIIWYNIAIKKKQMQLKEILLKKMSTIYIIEIPYSDNWILAIKCWYLKRNTDIVRKRQYFLVHIKKGKIPDGGERIEEGSKKG